MCALMTAYSSETRLIIYKFPRSICMSFTKYVEVAEKSAIMNMLPAKVTVWSIDSGIYVYTILIGDAYSGGFKVRIVCGYYSVNFIRKRDRFS